MRRGAILALCLAALLLPAPARAGETTGAISGTVNATAGGTPIAGARIDASSGNGRYETASDVAGRFTFAAVAPGTYVLSIAKPGYVTWLARDVVVAPAGRTIARVRLETELPTIGAAATHAGIVLAQSSDVTRVTGQAARAPAIAASSGLGTVTRGVVQGAVSGVPGVQQDPFANAVVRGGKLDDVVFRYDDVPVAQGLIAEPGGNIVGAQLPTTGVATTTVATAGMSLGPDNALGAVIDEIPATGTYPPQGDLRALLGIAPSARALSIDQRWATPDLRARYAVAARVGDETIRYGDGTTFLPAEAGTFGLALADRATWSLAANAHLRLDPRDDLELAMLSGAATYDQYGTPFAGQTYGAFDGATTVYPGEPSPGALVTTPSRTRGTYSILKAELTRTFDHGYGFARIYRSQYGSTAAAPFFDDLAFPNGAVSYFGTQSSRLDGVGVGTTQLPSTAREWSAGLELRRQTFALDQLIPTLDSELFSAPAIRTGLAYVAGRWLPGAWTIEAALRGLVAQAQRSDGTGFSEAAVDPHVSVAYRHGDDAVRLVYDHATVAPQPLEVERNEAGSGIVRAPLAPERANALELSYAHVRRTSVRVTGFFDDQRNRIDVLPANVRSVGQSGQAPGFDLGVPTNAGRLLSAGAELALDRGPWTVAATYVHARSSSASQFALNDLNAAAIAAAHLFPVGYVPDLSVTASYRARAGAVTIVPSLSWENGYPYGNGRMTYVFNANGQPVQVPNDNHVNPGYNYYFLRDPSLPFDAASNPYVGSMGTPEGNDPNTLRSAPLLLLSLRAQAPLSRRVSLTLDVANLLGTSTPTQLQGNPYLIGPPGYAGGNPLYAAWYGTQLNGAPYTLGNGVPTNDGSRPVLPWRYGTGGYVPSSYPEFRSVTLELKVTL